MWKVEYFNSYHGVWMSMGETASKARAQVELVEWKFRFPSITFRLSKIEKEKKEV